MANPGRTVILLVDDDKIDQEGFSRLVKREHLAYDFTIADSVMAARALLERRSFDLLLVDYALQDGNGFDVMKIAPYGTPVIFITGSGSEETAVQALQAGASDYIIKDVDRAYLKLLPITIDRAFRKRHMERELSTLSHALKSSSESIFITDLHDRISFVNQAFQRTYGYTEREIIGAECNSTLLGPEAVRHPIDETETEVIHIRKNGQRFPALLSRSTVYNENGEAYARVIVARDMSEQHEAMEALRNSEEKYRSVVTALGEGVVLQDRDGVIRTCNASAERILGMTADQMMGRTSLDPRWRAVHEDGSAFPGSEHPSMRTLQTGQPYYGVVMGVYKPGGGFSWIVINTEPLWNEGETLPYAVVASFSDITELKNTINERNALIKSLSAFAHTVAHDLKNPVALITGYAGLLLGGMGEFTVDEMQRYLGIIEATGYKITHIIDALLLLASTREMTDVPTETLDMERLVQESLLRLQKLRDEKGATIEIVTPLPPAIGYAPWVEEIWVNYLSNAFKYGGNPPRIEIGAVSIDEAPLGDSLKPVVTFYVRDNGHGLSSIEQEKLFNPYQRLATDHIEGHGLGLSIVRDIAERLGGKVAVTSAPGGGSIFSFTLPAAVVPVDHSKA
jgi:PAS domain S-box-containing protein